MEDCKRKCSTPQKRRLHLVDKHMFPKDYDFQVVDYGIDQRSSMLRSGRHRRRSSAAQHKSDIEERARRRTSTNSKLDGHSLIEGTSGNMIDLDGAQPSNSEISGPATTTGLSKDNEMDGLVGAMSSLKFIPTSVRFGRGRGRGGFSRS